MVHTQVKDYNQSENSEENMEELVSVVEKGGSLLPSMTVNHFQRWIYSTFENIDDDGRVSMKRNQYLGRSNGVAFNN